MKNKLKFFKKIKDNSEDLTDIKDGTIYKNLLESEDGESFKNNEAFSFLLNADGISVCTKSKLTIWFLIENMILAGMIKSL